MGEKVGRNKEKKKEGETIIRIYLMGEKLIFEIRGKKENKNFKTEVFFKNVKEV